MKRLLAKYERVAPHERDYTALLRDTNVFGAGRDLEWDDDACQELGMMVAEAEAHHDLTAAWRFLSGGPAYDAHAMKVSCELEYWAFFEPHHFRRMLYIGSGAYPHIALYALARLPELQIDGVDLTPHCKMLCSAVAAKLGFADRFRARTARGEDLDPDCIHSYDAFFLSSAVRPKNAIIEFLLRHRCPQALIYAREDQAHPHFYEPVEIEHPDVFSARRARALWQTAKGHPPPLPEGCELAP
ncbi:MAG: hypothetical protein ACRDR6_05825 [Pseudonocardiaceae bacterium]